MVRYLLDHGADPTIENNRGFCPAKYCTDEETRKLLQEYSSKVIQHGGHSFISMSVSMLIIMQLHRYLNKLHGPL